MDLSKFVMIAFSTFIVGVGINGYLNPKKAEKLAQAVVILGILGTFIGVAIGLYNFNVDDIDKSLPLLLEGLKTAFITSIIGQIVSLVLNNFVKSPKLEGEIARNEIDMADLLSALKKIEKSISGDGETTLITQIQKLRTTNHDDLNDLNKSFGTFVEKMAETNSKALIEALEGVMRDFNTKINEQFGDNFKQLNSAVGQMLVWQKEYREFVEITSKELADTTEIIKNAILSIGSTQKTLDKITNQTNVFQQSAKKLDDLLLTLASTLTSLNQIGEKSRDIFPALESNIKSISTNVNNLIKETGQEISQQTKNVTNVYSNMQRQINTTVEETSKKLENQVLQLDKELGKELNKALESLGSQLVSLSNKFVSDYTPLTEELKKVVEIGRRINARD